jgi:(p)ppGpp synthase/HD superfamily hydrolase
MTQEIYQKAILFAGEKHSQQQVPATQANYLLHVSNVAMEVMMAYAHEANFDINLALQAAILHDTLEDTETTYDEISDLFGESVAQAVLALTKNEKLPSKQAQMADSLKRLETSVPEAGLVKLADRITNLQEPPFYWTKEKKQSYLREAKQIWATLKHTNPYLGNRLSQKIEAYPIYF